MNPTIRISHKIFDSHRNFILKDLTNGYCLDEWKIFYDDEINQRKKFENDLIVLGFEKSDITKIFEHFNIEYFFSMITDALKYDHETLKFD